MNHYEDMARAHKATALLGVAWERGNRVPDLHDDAAWQGMARQAGVNPPSLRTRKLVTEALTAPTPDDPFEDLS